MMVAVGTHIASADTSLRHLNDCIILILNLRDWTVLKSNLLDGAENK
jgi:hypothetical protein